MTFDTQGSDFDTLLAVYTGSSVGALTVVASNDDAIGRQSEVSFVAQQGVFYHIAVDGYSGATGAIVLNWEQASSEFDPGFNLGPGADNVFIFSPVITGTPGRQTASNAGASKEFGEPSHAGNRGGASVWWSWEAPATGTVTFDTQGSDFDTLLAVYTGSSVGALTVVASNDDAIGRQSEVSFVAQQGVFYHIAVDGYSGATGAIVLNWEQASSEFDPGFNLGPGADNVFIFSPVITGTPGRQTASNAGASKEFGEPSHAGNRGGASVWWSWEAPATGTVTFDTQGSDFDTLLAVYTGSSVGALTVVASNDDAIGRQSEVSFVAQQGVFYHIAVDGYSGATGAIVLNWSQAGGPGPGPGPGPDPGTPSDGICISGRTMHHTLVDGHVAVGHEIIRIAPAPSVAGLTSGYHGQRNSNGDYHGRVLFVYSSGRVEVYQYDNGVLLSKCGYNSEGRPFGYFTSYVNGDKEGVEYFFYSSGRWVFYTYSVGVRHGPYGGYSSEGRPFGYFTPYVNGDKEGVEYFFYSSGRWVFYTYSVGVRHGPYGGYNTQGQKHGYFGSHTNGNKNPGEVWYNNGVAR